MCCQGAAGAARGTARSRRRTRPGPGCAGSGRGEEARSAWRSPDGRRAPPGAPAASPDPRRRSRSGSALDAREPRPRSSTASYPAGRGEHIRVDPPKHRRAPGDDLGVGRDERLGEHAPHGGIGTAPKPSCSTLSASTRNVARPASGKAIALPTSTSAGKARAVPAGQRQRDEAARPLPSTSVSGGSARSSNRVAIASAKSPSAGPAGGDLPNPGRLTRTSRRSPAIRAVSGSYGGPIREQRVQQDQIAPSPTISTSSPGALISRSYLCKNSCRLNRGYCRLRLADLNSGTNRKANQLICVTPGVRSVSAHHQRQVVSPQPATVGSAHALTPPRQRAFRHAGQPPRPC